VHGGQVNGVEGEVGLPVEALVGPLAIVEDVQAQVAVVPGASVLAPHLLAGGVGFGSGPAAHETRILNASAGVGSANFTANGLIHNQELVTWRQDDAAVAELRTWFDRYWDDPACVDFTDELSATLRSTRFGGQAYSPYQLLIRTLAERYGTERPPALEGATFTLKWFQADAEAHAGRRPTPCGACRPQA